MRPSLSQDVLAVGQVQDEVNGFLRRRVEGFESFFESNYKAALLTIVDQIGALDVAPSADPRPSIRVSLPQVTPSGEAPEVVRVRYRDKWSKESSDTARVSIEGGTIPGDATPQTLPPRESIATPIPDFEFGEILGTPPSRTMRPSFAYSQATWGDRFRSMTPLGSPAYRPNPLHEPNADVSTSPIEQTPEVEEALEQEAMCDVQLSPFPFEMDPVPEPPKPDAVALVENEVRKDSLIPKAPPVAVSTIQRMKDLVTLVDQAPANLMELTQPAAPTEVEVAQPVVTAEMELDDKNEKLPETEKAEEAEKPGNVVGNVKTFIEPPKRTEGRKIAAGTHKLEVSSLKQAAKKREQDMKIQAERQQRRAEMTRKKNLKQTTLPIKAASKPEKGAPNGHKRTTEVEPSPNKKQKLENARKHKKMTQHASRPAIEATPPPSNGGALPAMSPQYHLTPVGELATDNRAKRQERRRDKHVPSWASEMALQNSALVQKSKDASQIFPTLATLDPSHVFGTPDSMVVRNAAERSYRYANRAPSSVNWSQDEED